jgi:SAM-dependent methyltransferase
MSTSMTTEMEALKTRLKAMWMSGDYGHFAKFLEPGAMEFFPTLQIVAGERVLDVGCGAGQLAIPAAQAGANVTGIDIATNLIEQAQARAKAEGLEIRFQEGDAEDIAYEDGEFDLVFSLIGAMFAPRPDRVASEFIRVCRPGGRIIMGNWSPGGFVGQMFKIMGKHVPPPAGMPSPVLWGDEATVRQRFSEGIADLQLTRKMYPFKYPFPPSEVVEFFRAYYGPTNRAFASLDADKQAALRSDLEHLWSEHNKAAEGETSIDSEYLEVVAIRA